MGEHDTGIYIRVTCSVCRGMNRGCPYCDEMGKNYIQPSNKRISEWLKSRSEEDKREFRHALEDM